jgi:hypothetical protein
MTTKAELKVAPPPRTPTLSFLGDLPLVTLTPLDRLHPATLARIDRVERALAAADRLAASRLILAIEADMGITTADRIAAMKGQREAWEGDLEAAIHALSGPPAEVAPLIIDTDRHDPAELDENDIVLLGEADAERNRSISLGQRARKAQDQGNTRAAKVLRQQAKAALHNAKIKAIRLGRNVEERVDRAYAKDALDQVLVTEARRGGTVDDVDTYVTHWVRDENGAMVNGEDGLPQLAVEKATARRVNERSGLRLAWVNGDLDGERVGGDALYEEGKLYAEQYQLSESMRSGQKGEGRCAPGPTAPQQMVLEARALMRVLRKGLTERQVTVLDCVCGQDHSLRATADSMRAGVPSIRRTLRCALAQARSSRIEWEKERREQATQRRGAAA